MSKVNGKRSFHLADKLTLFFRGNSLWFFLFAALSLLIPDLVLKSLVIFIDFTVSKNAFYQFFLCHLLPLLFTGLWICLILFLCVFIMPKKSGRIVFAVIASLSDILMISEFIYYTMFGRFFMLNSIFLATEGAAYIPILYQYITPWLVLYVILAVGSLIMACKLWRTQNIPKKFYPIALVFPVLIFVFSSYMTVSPREKKSTTAWSTWKDPRFVYSDMADPDRCVRIMGIYQFMVRNITYPIFHNSGFTDDDYSQVDSYVKARESSVLSPSSENEMTDYFKDKNVIAIMLESIDDWMITPETMPTVYSLMNDSINFKNHIATPFGGGYTFNSEFAFNTGYYTPKSSSSASIYGYNEFPYTMPKLFAEKGYTPNQFHYNKKEFYNRSTMHKAFGYENYVSFMDYMPEKEAELDSNAMLLDGEPIYKKMTENEKFFDYIITYSAHLPYNSNSRITLAAEKYPELVNLVSTEDFRKMLLEADAMCDEIDFSEITDEKWQAYTDEYNNARLLAKDTDEFIRLLIEKLERDNLMDDTVFIIFTDHYSYGYSNVDIVKGLSVLGGERFIEETPFFIYHKGSPKMEITKVSSTKDILPTVINLFGLDRFGGYIGDDIFDPFNKGMVYFSSMTWYDGEIYRDANIEINDSNREYIEMMDKKMMDCVTVNDIIVAGNYFSRQK